MFVCVRERQSGFGVISNLSGTVGSPLSRSCLF